jgi:uroporphyrinogen decarboxylase
MRTTIDAIGATLRRQRADFVPSRERFWGDTREVWASQGMPVGEDGQPDGGLLGFFGIETGNVGNCLGWQAKKGGEVLEETDEWIVRRNGNGGALKTWKDRSGTPEHVDFHMTTRKIWEEEYRPHLIGSIKARVMDPGKMQQNIDAHHAAGRFAEMGGIFLWEILRASLGDMTLYMAVYDDPDWIHDFNRVYTDLFKEAFLMQKEAGVLPDGVWLYEDLGYKDRLFCNPAIYEELFFPYYKELIDLYHSCDLPVVLHSCGFQETAIPLIIDAGFDGLNPMEVKAGNDIMKYAEQFGDKIAFVGGLDARLLASGDRALIEKGVTDFMVGMKERGASFIYGSDHSIPPNVNYADYCFSLEVYRRHRER